MFSGVCAFGAPPSPWVGAGIGTYARFTDVGFDSLGNVFVAACFTDSLEFGGTTLPGSGFALLKLDAAGELVWSVYEEGGCPTRLGAGLAGDSYLGGQHWGSLAIGDTALSVFGFWAARYDEAGDFDWARLVSDDSFIEGLNSIQATSTGHVLLAGQFDGALHFGPSILRCPAYFCGYVLECDAAGAPVWAIRPQLSSPSAATDAAGNTYVGDAGSVTRYDTAKNPVWTAAPNVIDGVVTGMFDVNSSGMLGVVGLFRGTVEFGSTTLVTTAFWEAFVAKIAPDGQFSRAETLSLDGGSGLGLAGAELHAAIDEDGNVYVSGTSLLKETSQELFVVAKFDANGEFQWEQHAVSTASTRGLGCDVSAAGSLAAVGSYLAATSLGGVDLPNPPGVEAAFLALYPPQTPTAAQPADRPHPALSLSGAPNPFNPLTSLGYWLPNPGQVRLAVYSLEGKLVRVLVDRPQAAGPHEAVWDGRNGSGKPLPSGTYIALLEAGEQRRTRKLALLK